MAQLTAGAVNSMNNNQAAGIKPTLQLIDVKKIRAAAVWRGPDWLCAVSLFAEENLSVSLFILRAPRHDSAFCGEPACIARRRDGGPLADQLTADWRRVGE